MAMHVFWNRLLALPPPIRLQAIQHVSRGHSSVIGKLSVTPKRTFSATTRILARNIPKPSKRSPTSGSPLQQQQPQPQPTASSQPSPQSYPSQIYSPGETYALSLLQRNGNARELLLYLSPVHRSFFFKCYFTGVALLAGSWAFASLITPGGDKNSQAAKLPFWIKVLSFGPMLFMAGAATLFLIGPSKLVDRVSIVAGAKAGAPPLLRFRIKSPIPLPRMKSKIIDRPMDHASIEDVMSSSSPSSIQVQTVSIEDLSTFTEEALHKRATGEKKGALAWIKNVWPQLQIDVRKMSSREGMAYVNLKETNGHGHTKYKLDFWNATVVENGWPLKRLMEDKEIDTRGGLFTRIFR